MQSLPLQGYASRVSASFCGASTSSMTRENAHVNDKEQTKQQQQTRIANCSASTAAFSFSLYDKSAAMLGCKCWNARVCADFISANFRAFADCADATSLLAAIAVLLNSVRSATDV